MWNSDKFIESNLLVKELIILFDRNLNNGIPSLRNGFLFTNLDPIIRSKSFSNNNFALIIDDLIATGGTAEAAAKLVEMSNAKISAFVFAINLFDLGGSDNLIKKGYKVENLMDFPGH